MAYAFCFTGRSLKVCLEASNQSTSWLEREEPPANSAETAAIRTADATYWIHRDDPMDAQLIIAFEQHSGRLFPKALDSWVPQALTRMAAFLTYAQTRSIKLPPSWGQYKTGSLISFWAWSRLSRSFETLRWIAEPQPGDTHDIVFWRLSTVADQTPLEAYKPTPGDYNIVRDSWTKAFARSRSLFGTEPPESVATPGTTLGTPWSDQTRAYTYSAWLERLTSSQRTFVESDPNESIRLRGPAGSGKTLALELKLLREYSHAKAHGKEPRILFVTHSWASAERTDTELNQLSEWGPVSGAGGVDVYPLLTIAQELAPPQPFDVAAELISDDSFSGKKFQIDLIEEALNVVLKGDWLTYRDKVTAELYARVEQVGQARLNLLWDLLVEFSCVLGAEGIFPGYNARRNYERVSRHKWMLPLHSKSDRDLVFRVYEEYSKQLDELNCFTSDQVVNDFLNYLVGNGWNRRRIDRGYDYIFVDELQLFDAQERLLLRYMTRNTQNPPRVFMALDPRQSPWEVYVPEGGGGDSGSLNDDGADAIDGSKSVDLPTIHRFTPEILGLVKHIHREFPMLDFEGGPGYDLSKLSASAESGGLPAIVECGSRESEMREVVRQMDKLLRTTSGPVAIALLDELRLPTYQAFLKELNRSDVAVVDSKSDIDDVSITRGRVFIGPSEYLAGLQYEAVIVCAFPETDFSGPNSGYKHRQFLSLLYVAVSRARREVVLVTNGDRGGVPEVLLSASDNRLTRILPGPEV